MQGANLGHGSRDAHLCSFGLPLSSTQAVRDVRCLMFYWSTVGGQGWTAAVHDDAVYLHGGSDLNFCRKQQPNSRNHPQYTRSSEATLLFHGLVSGEATMSPHSLRDNVTSHCWKLPRHGSTRWDMLWTRLA